MEAEFFSGNRKRLIESMGEALVVLIANTKVQGAGDSAAAFRQEANFWYLTGIDQPDWHLIIDGKRNTSWLIAPEVDAVSQMFDGSLDVATAKKISDVDGVLEPTDGAQILKELSKQYSTVQTLGTPPYAKYASFALNPAQARLRRKLKSLFAKVLDCRHDIGELRAIKQPVELRVMEQAATFTIEALEKIRENLTAYRYEYEIEAELSCAFRQKNAFHAFDPIVASGKNACTLHYVKNDSAIEQGALLLIDTGARIGEYPADITRMFAVRESTKRQDAVHSSLQIAQQRILKIVRPGLSLKDYKSLVDDIMKEALVSLGLMAGKKDEDAYYKYFPHAVSHGLGLDVHESLGGYKELRSGMVLTVEPGIYIPEEGIGVRIENTVAITDRGHTNLTSALSTDM